MVLGDVPPWLSQVGSAAGQAAANAALQTAASQFGPGQTAPAPPAKSEGIPTPVLIVGASVLGLVLLKILTSRPERAVVKNPSRRRRRRRR